MVSFNAKGFIVKLFKKISWAFKMHEIPDDHEPCPNCGACGTEDGLLICAYCKGYGHVHIVKALNYPHHK